jgi:hypothetical protein
MELLGFIGLFYVVLLLVLPFLVWGIFRRLKKIERILKIAPEFGQTAADTAELLERVERLERLIGPEGAELVREPAFPPPSVTWKAEAVPAAPPVSVPAAPEAASFLAVPAHEAEAPAPAAPVPSPMPELLEPAPPLTAPAETQPIEQPETARKPVSQEEWEELVGGSWLNKLGVVVLVIGLALFLGYSLKYFGPAGRVAIGLAASFAMLFAGMLLERSTAYMLYARGLIGGGWAALYFTTYAMHGLEAARIVADPLLGIILLVMVAVGMIAHSLRYRSEVVTGMAYFVAFFTLAISPVSGFSVFALAPLAASLLVVAYRFSWAAMTVGGLIATYGIYFLFSGIGFPASPFKGDFTSGQATLAVYWLLFEVFDLLDIRKHPHEDSVARAILPLNAVGFVGVSLLHWMAAGRTDLHVLFAASAVAYLVSALLRARVQAPSSFTENSGTAERMSAGGYEGAVTVAAALAAFAIFHRFSGLEISILLLLEGEALFLAGLALRQPYLRLLGAVVFAVSLAGLGWETQIQSGHKTIAGVELHAWTPVALLTAALLYLNRGLFHPDREPRLLLPEKIYSFAATGVLLAVLKAELPLEYLGVGCLILAAPLFELGLHRRFAELRPQAYGVAILAFAVLAGINILGAEAKEAGSPWLTLGLAALLSYAAGAHAFRLAPEHLAEDERLVVRDLSLAAGAILLAALLWKVLPTPLVAVGWGVEALALIELGFPAPATQPAGPGQPGAGAGLRSPVPGQFHHHRRNRRRFASHSHGDAVHIPVPHPFRPPPRGNRRHGKLGKGPRPPVFLCPCPARGDSHPLRVWPHAGGGRLGDPGAGPALFRAAQGQPRPALAKLCAGGGDIFPLLGDELHHSRKPGGAVHQAFHRCSSNREPVCRPVSLAPPPGRSATGRPGTQALAGLD